MIWVDAPLLPNLAPWIQESFGVDACSISRLGLLHASDREIFEAARAANVIVMTKDIDFVMLLEEIGPPPSLLWVTCGNTSNAALRRLLGETLKNALDLIGAGAPLVEITDLAHS